MLTAVFNARITTSCEPVVDIRESAKVICGADFLQKGFGSVPRLKRESVVHLYMMYQRSKWIFTERKTRSYRSAVNMRRGSRFIYLKTRDDKLCTEGNVLFTLRNWSSVRGPGCAKAA